MVYVADNFDHRVHTSIKEKDKASGIKLLTKSRAPMKDNPSDKTSATRILDRDGEDFIKYQIGIKKYVDQKNKFEDDIQQIFDIVHEQCSPTIQQKLDADNNYKAIKDDAYLIKLLKIIKHICYNY